MIQDQSALRGGKCATQEPTPVAFIMLRSIDGNFLFPQLQRDPRIEPNANGCYRNRVEPDVGRTLVVLEIQMSQLLFYKHNHGWHKGSLVPAFPMAN